MFFEFHFVMMSVDALEIFVQKKSINEKWKSGNTKYWSRICWNYFQIKLDVEKVRLWCTFVTKVLFTTLKYFDGCV